MRDLLLYASGVLGLIAAFLHGYLGETRVFARVRIEPERLRTLIRLVWHCSVVAWAAVGVLLIAAPLWVRRLPDIGSSAPLSSSSASPQSPMPGLRAGASSDGPY
jgi:hypothetical protein